MNAWLERYGRRALLAFVFLPVIFTRWLPQIGNPNTPQNVIFLNPTNQIGIQNAINSAANGCNGKIQLAAGIYPLADITSAQELLIGNSVGVGNCSLEFAGAGEGVTILQYSTSVPNTEDIIRVAPGNSTAIFGLYIHDLSILPAGPTTTAARYGINFDETNGLIAHLTVDRVRIGLNAANLQSNYALFNTNTVPSCNPLFLASFDDDTFWGGVSLINIGDSVRFRRTNITGPRDFFVQTVSVGCHSDGGAHGFVVEGGNITTCGATIIKNAWAGWFSPADVEQTCTSTEANGALLDIQGTSGAGNPTENFIVQGGYWGCATAFGCVNAIRVDQAYHTILDHPYITQGSGAAILTTANADRTEILMPTHAPNGNLITSWLSDSGTNTHVTYVEENTGNKVEAGPIGFTGTTNSTNRVFGIEGVQVRTGSTGVNCFATGADILSAGCDTGISRASAGVIALGNGVQADVTATIAPLAFAQLPASGNGTIVGCSNCLPGSNPCTGASTGALAVRQNGAWVCK